MDAIGLSLTILRSVGAGLTAIISAVNRRSRVPPRTSFASSDGRFPSIRRVWCLRQSLLECPHVRPAVGRSDSRGQVMSIEDSGTDRILRRRQVEACTGLSRSTIYRRMQAGTFPPAIPLGGRLVGWRAADIDAFLMNPARYRVPALNREDDAGGRP